MFKGLGNLFERRKTSLVWLESKSVDIRKILDIFFKEKFDQEGSHFYSQINYSLKDGSLTVRANNKTIANELVIQLGDLHDLFKKEKVNVKQIIII